MFADVLQHESAVFIIAVGTLFRQVESSPWPPNSLPSPPMSPYGA